MLTLAICAIAALIFVGSVIALPDGYDPTKAVPDPAGRYNHIMIPGGWFKDPDTGEPVKVPDEVFHVDYDSWAETHRQAGKNVPPDRHLGPPQDNGKELDDLKGQLLENKGKMDLLLQQAAARSTPPPVDNSGDIAELRAELAAVRAELAAAKSAPASDTTPKGK